jgi:hypothetical protein
VSGCLATLPVPGDRLHLRGASGREEAGTCTAVRHVGGGLVQVDADLDDGTRCWFTPEQLVCDPNCDCLDPIVQPICGYCGCEIDESDDGFCSSACHRAERLL